MKLMQFFSAFVLFTAMLGAPAARADSPLEAALDVWGGEGVHLKLEGNQVKVELGCAHGKFLRPSFREGYSFRATGWLQSDEMTNPPPAKIVTEFRGEVTGGLLTLIIQPQGQPEQKFQLKKGEEPLLMKCQ